ncbi:hypothetical protein BDV27DRAFT_139831 [Aspergillus caelatus]|uniref:Zn(2)-C6 fungal-type domain-containing protein n=1 Tax=Aspergillus caelatus TaxID=61420 RepID=A0A5N6ZHP5_9EURO|nr:uncharacterized protein BDV27DRAFT_139831 [Aspergillus caelatus]KAE8357172.1 hypothetical protein BDV27DRAFT_139831 [Aspergillus caelatus]
MLLMDPTRADSGEQRPSKGLCTETAKTTAATQGQRQRTRAAIACAVCRSRKTKCDGRRPVCGYCHRTRSDCQYDVVDAATTVLSYDVGSRILQAIEQLTELVKTNVHQETMQSGPTGAFAPLALSQGPSSSPRLAIDRWTNQLSNVSSPYQYISSEGLDSVVRWHVFPSEIGKIPVDNGKPIPMPDELPPIAMVELNRLLVNYRRVVHDKNPMLDMVTLYRYMTHVSENGLDFSTRTCLVMLVCAIGALCQENMLETPGNLPVPGRSSDLDIAYRFWSVAAKRLGCAMSKNTLESAQCLCLAGIWFMCNLQPLDAWKHFTMAGNCFYSAVLARKSMGSSDPWSLELVSQATAHAIFHTAYKSELEIRYELEIPGSVLEYIEDQLIFPSPPEISDTPLEVQSTKTITWYYYLADIAARHLINRIVNARHKLRGPPNETEVRALLRDYKILSSHVEDWYKSLPQEISFDPPNSPITPEVDWFKNILRARYLLICEILCRPFLRICLNYTLNLSEQLKTEVARIASLGLQYCVWSLQSVGNLTRLDHGMWTGIRYFTANAMILIGAARSHMFPALNGACYIWLPTDWRGSVKHFLDTLEIFSEETRGGVIECYKIILWGLEDFDRTAA